MQILNCAVEYVHNRVKKSYVFQVSNYNFFRLNSYKTSLDELKLKLLMSAHVTIVNNSDSIKPPSNSLVIALKST